MLATFVINKYHDVLAANALAKELLPDIVPGRNQLRALFTDPESRQLHPDWERVTATAVAHLRAHIGTETEDERLHALIGELSLKSDRFRKLWSRHDVRLARGGTVLVRHAKAGDLELLAEKFAVVGPDRLEAVLLHAEPGSRAAEALAMPAALGVQGGR